MAELVALRQTALVAVGQSVDRCGGMLIDGVARSRIGFTPGEVYAPAL